MEKNSSNVGASQMQSAPLRLGQEPPIRMVKTFGPNSRGDMMEIWKPDGTITPAIRSKAQSDLTEIRRAMDSPNIRDRTLARVKTLLDHYYVPGRDEMTSTIIANDWAMILADYPWIAIQAAAVSWLKSETRRPTPAEFLERVKTQMFLARRRIEELQRIVDYEDHEQGADQR